MNKVTSNSCANLTYLELIGANKSMDDTIKDDLKIMGIPIRVNPYLPKDTAVFVNDKGDIVRIIKIGNRKVLLKLWGFEIAYYAKVDEQACEKDRG